MADPIVNNNDTSVTSIRRVFPNANGIRPFVMDELKRRKSNFPTPTAAPFVKLTSMQQSLENNYRFFSLGLHGYEIAANENIFDPTYGDQAPDVVGYGYEETTNTGGRLRRRLIRTNDLSYAGLGGELSQKIEPELIDKFDVEAKKAKETVDTSFARGAHPIPGIKGVDIERNAINPTITTVRWACYNRAQLEFIRNHFLIAGNYVVLEWGNTFSDRLLTKTLDFADPNILDELVKVLAEGRRYIIDQYVRPNAGNYEFFIGRVMDFEVNIDEKTGVYHCTTQIASVGESAWGLSTYSTFVHTKTDEDTKKISSISDYFAYGRGFDQLISKLVGDPKMVAKTDSNFAKNNQNSGGAKDRFKNFSTDPLDNYFISWECFATRVINDLVSMIDETNVQNDLKKYLDLMPLENQADIDQEDWVGANQFLRTTDPSAMILIGTTVLKNAGGFGGAGAYDSFNQPGRGKLSRGVWLNSGAVRQAFQGANQFYFGLQSLIGRMNLATEGYWNLVVFYDEETNMTKVVDVNCATNRMPHIYMFNQGEKGELLGLELKSSFPPELKMMILNYNNFRTSTLPTRQELLEKYPQISGTNGFVYAMNWTSLEDALSKRLSQLDGGTVIPASEALKRPDSAQHDDRISNRIAEPSKLTSAKVASNSSGHALGAPVGAPVASNKASTVTRTSGRNVTVNIPKGVGSRGTIAYRHKNPGNLEFMNQPGAVQGEPKDGGGYWAKFESDVDGFNALCRDIDIKKEKTVYDQNTKVDRGMTLREFVYIYAPPTQNNSELYLQQVAVQLKGKDSDPIRRFDTLLLAKVVANKESSTSITGQDIAALSTQPPAPLPKVPMAPVSNIANPVPATPGNKSILVQDQTKEKTDNELHKMFGTQLDGLVETTPSVMKNIITRDGYQSYPNPNAFVWNFPTSTKVGLTIQGISGISFSDIFVVDKLPFIYERHGVFHTQRIVESVTEKGWVTKVEGIYKMIWLGNDKELSVSRGFLKNE
jgi:hypothetical protein